MSLCVQTKCKGNFRILEYENILTHMNTWMMRNEHTKWTLVWIFKWRLIFVQLSNVTYQPNYNSIILRPSTASTDISPICEWWLVSPQVYQQNPAKMFNIPKMLICWITAGICCCCAAEDTPKNNICILYGKQNKHAELECKKCSIGDISLAHLTLSCR